MSAQIREFHRRLEEALKSPIQLSFHRNRTTYLSLTQTKAGLRHLRLHQGFLSASDSVFLALVAFILREGSSQETQTLREFGETCVTSEDLPSRRQQLRLRSQGQYHHLQPLLKQVLQEYFPHNPQLDEVLITYGRGSRSLIPRRSLHLGSYQHSTNCITIHPLLDQDLIPVWFVKFVIFHELLHADLPRPSYQHGRRIIHSRDFQSLERRHPDYQRASQFSRDLLRGLPPHSLDENSPVIP